MKHTILILLIAICFSAQAQRKITKKTDPIVEEGKYLYQLEKASWHGTDLMLERVSDRNTIGGYFSYVESDSPTCVFFSQGEQPQIIATIRFDQTLNPESAKILLQERAFSSTEQDLFDIRSKALAKVSSDTMFKRYQNTNLNIIPVIRNGEKKVFVITGPQVAGVIVLGNDYLIRFDKRNDIIETNAIHQNIIPVEYDDSDGDISFHSHAHNTGDFITSTDICTLMLYGPFTKWKTHYVMSENYVCVWDFVNNDLSVITREAWDNIYDRIEE